MKGSYIHRFLWLAIIVLLLMACLLTSIGMGLHFPALLPDKFSFQNWKLVFSSAGLGETLLRSLVISLVVSFCSTILAFIVSFRWNDKKTQESSVVFYLPYLISPIIFAVCLQIAMLKIGVAGNPVGVILGQMCIAYPYGVILLRGIWGRSLMDRIALSRNLGVPKAYIIRKVILPASSTLLMLCLIQTFLISWFDFAFVQMLGMGQVKTMTLALYQSILEANLSLGAVSAILIFMPPAVLFTLNYRNLSKQWEV